MIGIWVRIWIPDYECRDEMGWDEMRCEIRETSSRGNGRWSTRGENWEMKNSKTKKMYKQKRGEGNGEITDEDLISEYS